MKLFFFIMLMFLSSCTTRGEVISSQGLIESWKHDGFWNSKDGVEVLFNVVNDNYIKHENVLFGIATKDINKNKKIVIGKKPFTIKVDIKSANAGVSVKQNAKLLLNGDEIAPQAVIVGEDDIYNGQRQSRNILLSEHDNFMPVDEKLKEFNNNWIWFNFNIVTPSPDEAFTLYLELKRESRIELLEVVFLPKRWRIYHH